MSSLLCTSGTSGFFLGLNNNRHLAKCSFNGTIKLELKLIVETLLCNFYLFFVIFLISSSVSATRPRLKNIDRSSAQHLEVTVGDLTVIITDFKEKAKPSTTSATSSSAASAADHHSQNGSSSENTEKGLSRSSSPRGEGSLVNGESH